MWAMAVGKGGDSLGIMFVMKLIEGDAEAASKRRSSWSSTKDLKVCFCDFIKAEDLLNVVICCFRQSGPIYCRYVTTLQDQNFALPRPLWIVAGDSIFSKLNCVPNILHSQIERITSCLSDKSLETF